MNKSICDDGLKIVYKHGRPDYIRDKGGVLFSFKEVGHFSGQDERYRREIEQQYRLADFLLAALKGAQLITATHLPDEVGFRKMNVDE